MSRQLSALQALHVITEQPGTRFLGLSVDEWNRRVAGRLARGAAPHDALLPTLTVPAGSVITPALVTSLPPPNAIWHLHWAAGRPPVVWRGPGATDDAGLRAGSV